jgi:hypothetical protein
MEEKLEGDEDGGCWIWQREFSSMAYSAILYRNKAGENHRLLPLNGCSSFPASKHTSD